MKTKKDIILSYMQEVINKLGDSFEGFTTQSLSSELNMQRTNLSSILNELVKDGKVTKINGRPVIYKLVQKNKKPSFSVFNYLIGHNGSLKNAVSLAKAAIMYPEDFIQALIIGENGVGTSYFARLMYEYAKEQNIIDENAQYIKFNCAYYANNENELMDQLFGPKGVLARASQNLLFINHVDYLTPDAINRLFEYMDNPNQKMIMICSMNKTSKVTKSVFYNRFAIKIELPSLVKRPYEERLELVERFFMDEAEKVKKEIKIDSELLRCFLLYYSQGNVKQLQNDIKIGCANAYVRQIDTSTDSLRVYINDCHSYIRKGFIFYKENRDKIESLIPHNYTYTFTPKRSKKTEQSLLKIDNRNSIYDVIEQKVNELRSREISEEDIRTIISADIESDLYTVRQQIESSEINREMLMKVVDLEIIECVELFLKAASKEFNRVYPASTFHGICLHLSTSKKKTTFKQSISNEKILEIVEKHKKEYAFTMRYTNEFERNLNIHLSIDEIIFITVFLCDNSIEKKEKKPSVLIVMHGNVASSIANTVNNLYKEHEVFAYDLLLDKDMRIAYDELKTVCTLIDNGQGILIIYDMGSIQVMCESIIQETGIRAKLIEVPLTMLILDCTIKLQMKGDLEDVYQEVLNKSFGSLGSLKENYNRQEIQGNKVIITLCRTGEGSALQMKEYLERNLTFDEEVSVVALAVGNPKTLIKELNRRQSYQKILCIVGTYDPKIHDIPYISIAQLFDTPVDKLPMLLALKDIEVEAFDYSAMYEYLNESLQGIDIYKIKKLLHTAIRKIKKIINNFSINEEVGLFMHIACSMNRIKLNDPLPLNMRKDSIIIKHKKLYNDLKDILAPLENSLDILFADDEIATIIEILV